ncbi:Ig-like domain-containing protein [Pedobacter sp. GR22-6]|uniref:Ig-like domain-containing protein n=1 Tax=Pedobacter sp. GR22-6 TaxID=3127957 RepID=UPI00307DC3FE
MIKPIRIVLFFLAIFFFIPKSYAQFPYVESFRNATASGIVFGGAPSAFLTASGNSPSGGTPIDAIGSGYLRLTNAEKNQKGYAYSMSDFPSSNGLKVEFEYATYGGSRADGISFFLFDATASPFTIGGFGGSLGYAQINTTTPISPGVSKGYLAIGLDEYGNFSNNNEGRQGGVGFIPGSVTLRGKGDGIAMTPDNYRFLTTVHPDELGVSLIGDGSQRISDPTNIAYRKVAIELIPNPSGGYNINVYLTKGGSPQERIKVIDNYYYPDAAPEKLRYGFASSTGDDTNFHEIRNVAIDLYTLNPIVSSDVKQACEGTTATIDITTNDKANATNTSIDKLTIDLDPATPGIQNTLFQAGKGTFSVNSLGIVQFVPLASFFGSATANYNLRDTNGTLSNTASVTFTYSAPPAAPDAGANDAINIFTPTGTYALQGSATGTNTGLWTQVSGPNAATFADPTLNTTTVNNLVSGIYVFRWTLSSAAGCTASDDVQLTVNHPPVAVNDVATTPLNTSVPISIVDNDTDDNGNANIGRGSIVIKTQPSNGTLSINFTTGIVTYLPNSGFTGTDTFTYTVKDANGAESNVATVTIVVNKTLVGTNDVTTTNVNTPVVVHVLDNDPKKAGASVLKNSDPLHGSIIVNPDGTISYTPVTGYSGKDTFTYKLVNSNGDESDPITVTVNVKPTGLTDTGNTRSNEAIIIPVKDNDPGKSGTTVVPLTSPLNGSISVNPAGNVVYTPTVGFSGKDTFQYLLRTADGVDSDPIIVNINVKPVGSPDIITTTPDVAVILPIKDNDLSKTGTTIVLSTNPVNGLVSIGPDGTVGYTPNTGYSGKDTFTYQLRTADGLDSDPIIVNITVKPMGSTDNVITAPNTSTIIQVKDNDVSKLNTTLTITTNPLHGAAIVNANGTVTYTPAMGYSGKDVFTYTLRTPDGIDSDPITVNINIKPIGSTDNVSTEISTPVTILVKDNDLSKTGTTVSLTSTPTNGTAVINGTGNPVYTPNPGFFGKDSFYYILRTTDGLDSDPILVNVDIRPAGSPDNVSTPPATPINIIVKNNDVSKTGTTVTISSNPTNGAVVLNADGSTTYTPNAGFSGKDTFTYFLNTSDGVQSTPITVTITVKPIGVSDNVVTPPNTPITISVKDNDPSKNGTTVVVVTNAAHGAVVLNPAGLPVYTPNTGYSGKDTFTYILRTADGVDSDPITVNIGIKPIGLDDIANTITNIPVNIPVKDNDPSKTGTTTVINTNPANGSVVLNTDGSVAYTPNTGFSGKDTFTYRLTTPDGGSSDPITVTVNVKPTGTPDAATTNSGVAVIIPVKDNDLSKVGTTVVIGTSPLHGTVTINSAGIPVYTPAPGYSGPDSFTYRLRTPDGLESDPILVNLTVRVPVVIPAPNLNIETPVSSPITINIPTPTGGTITITDPPDHGTITFDPSGKPIYTPNSGYSGPDDFTYIITDPDGNTSVPGKITINVLVSPKIGLAKKLVSATKNTDGSYKISYLFTVRNYGEVGIAKVSLVDELDRVFLGNTIKVTKLTATGTLKASSNYNGISVKELLDPSSSLAANGKETVSLEFNITLDQKEGDFFNTAVTRGYNSVGAEVTSDLSTDGLNPDTKGDGDVSPSLFTPVNLIKQNIFIPGGFSPNNDGVNDFFVVENGTGKQISLEVYNRWGNRIYKAAKYENTWNGKTTEGIHIGDDVPAGTYYYIITIDNKDKRVGYITINR